MMRRSGFTLIELLVALTLLAIISGGMAMAFSTSLRAAAAIRHRSEVTDERRKLVEQLWADLQGIWVRQGSQTTWFRGGDLSTDPNEVSASPGQAVASQGDRLKLTTARPLSTEALQSWGQNEGTLGPQSDVAQVSWQVEQDTDGSMVLVRRERTPPDPEVDETQDPSVVRTVMSRSVTSMKVYCFDGTQWLEQWDAALPPQDSTTSGSAQSAASGLPQAVQVTLTLARDATGRRGTPQNQPSADDLPLNIVVAMPGAQGQTVQQNAGGTG